MQQKLGNFTVFVNVNSILLMLKCFLSLEQNKMRKKKKIRDLLMIFNEEAIPIFIFSRYICYLLNYLLALNFHILHI